MHRIAAPARLPRWQQTRKLPPDAMVTFDWLHFSDLHQGSASESWLWPGVRELLLADLEELRERCGPWDLVLFSGDLTQNGTADDFARLDKTLDQIWQQFSKLGSAPSLLAVPGNHDLVLPDPRRPEALIFGRWGEYPDAHAEFWRDPASPYRQVLAQAFENYTAWHDRHDLCAVPRQLGMLPGDFSAVLTKDGVRLGVVGLNSAFLQLSDANYRGKLETDVRQFHGACDGDGPAWARACDFSLIMTHHPPDWLSPEARNHFWGEIAPPGRFTAHVFGHMHEHLTTTLTIGGSVPRRQIQGSSLFGFDRFGHGKFDRRHGYAACRIAVANDGTAILRMWPRVAKKHAAGHWRIVPDLDAFELLEDQGTRPEPLPCLRRQPRVPRHTTPPVSLREQVLAQARASLPRESLILKGITGNNVPLEKVYVVPPLALVGRSGQRLPTGSDAHCDPGDPRSSADAEISRWVEGEADESLLLIGEMGAGKSEFLACLCRDTFDRAVKSGNHPIPLWINAASVSKESSIDLVLARTKLSRDELTQGIRSDALGFRLFFDGVDESPQQFRRALDSLREVLGSSLRGVAASTRPGYFLPLVDASTVRVLPWHDPQVEEFLERWASVVDSLSIDRIRRSPYFAKLRSSLANPLIASFCAHIAALHPEALRNRTELFRAVLDYALQQWRRAGEREEMPVTMRSVPEMLEVLQPLALELVRGQRSSISQADLRRAVFQRDDSPIAVVDLVCGKYGLLAECEDGYTFTIRGLAEYLAGRELLSQGTEAIANAAREAWAIEPIRHAVVEAQSHRADSGAEILMRLLRDEKTDSIAYCNGQLRSVTVAGLAAGDIAEFLPTPLVEACADAVMRRLTEERTTWVGEAIQETVREVLLVENPLAQKLYEHSWRLLEGPWDRASWFETADIRCVPTLIDLLSERDPEVRAIACRKLASFADVPMVQRFLWLELFDDQDRGHTRPCVEAGLVLRGATRTRDFDPLKAQLVELLNRGSQMSSFAAALALFPGEASTAELAEGLHRGGRAGYYHDEIVAELAASDAGTAALDACWPDWRTPKSRWQTTPRKKDERSTTQPPPSSSTRFRLATGMLGGLTTMSGARLQEFLRLPGVCHALSHSAERLPESALPTLLPAIVNDGLCTRGRGVVQTLGRHNPAAARVLCDILTQAVESGDSRKIQQFPGRSIESLVLARDPGAIRAYSRWFAECHKYFIDLDDECDDVIPAEILEIEEISAAARNTLARRSEGQFLPWPPRVLCKLAPIWQNNEEIWSELSRILCAWGSNLDMFVSAVRNSHLPPRIQEKLSATLDVFLTRHGKDKDGKNEQYYWHQAVPRLVEYIRFRGYPATLLSFLERLAGRTTDPICGHVVIGATIALVPHLSKDELSRLSKHQAGRFRCHPEKLRDFPQQEARLLVGAAAKAWLDAFRANVGAVASNPALHRPLRDLLLILPSRERKVAAAEWVAIARGHEWPWVETDWPSGYTRPADEARRIAFEAGMILETCDEQTQASGSGEVDNHNVV